MMELCSSDVRFNIPVDLTFAELVLQRADQFGQRVALVDAGSSRSLTYSELRRDVIRLAVSLYGIGVRYHDRVCILLRNCVEFPIVFVALNYIGAICVPINPIYTKYELADIVLDCEPLFYVTTTESVDVVKHAISLLDKTSVKILTVGSGARLVDGALTSYSYELLLSSVSGDMVPVDIRHTQRLSVIDNRRLTSAICYSSGTTGKPKGCMITHHGYIGNSFSMGFRLHSSHFLSLSEDEARLTSPADDVTVAAMPMFHQYGILIYFAHALTVGSKLVVMSKLEVNRYLDVVEKYSATVLHMVPVVVSDLIKKTNAQRLRKAFVTVRQVMSSAVGLNKSTAEEFMTVLPPGAKLFQGFGMSEILFATIANISGDTKMHSVGQVLENVSLKIVDAATRRELGANQNGEVLVKSPMIMSGYWKNPEATKSSFEDNDWFKTGDIGYQDEAGNLYIVDRFKELLKYKGFQVSPVELETVLLRHPDVIDAAVVGVKDDQLGDLPRALVVVRRPDVNTQDISDFVNERVAVYKRLRAGVFVVDSIPRTASGKIIRRQLSNASGRSVASSKL